jgi:serine/threonine-protein kinase RsbW
MNGSNTRETTRRVLGRVAPLEFIGRTNELRRLIAQTTAANEGRGLLLLMEPSAGVSELLRQAYDHIFNERGEVIPIYFNFTRNDATAVSAAIEFLNSFVQQYIAFRRDEPWLCQATLTFEDLIEAAPAADRHWLDHLFESYTSLRFSNDDKALVRLCLGAPTRVPADHGRPFVMLDGAQLAEYLNGSVVLGPEVLRSFTRSGLSFVLAGLRRQILNAAHEAEVDFENIDLLHLERLKLNEAQELVDQVSGRQQVITSREARDLLVQQFGGSPLFITTFLQAARAKNISLISYLDCERLYVDELLGGHIHRYFSELLEETLPTLDARQLLVKLLWEAIVGEEQNTSFESWRKRLHLSASALEEVLYRLHTQEFLNWEENTIETGGGPQIWKDYLKVRYRLDVLSEPRALVFAEALTDALKRAPRTMALHYQTLVDLGLRNLLSRFDCHLVPRVLFDNAAFNAEYRGEEEEAAESKLQAEEESIKLPQTIHVASSVSFLSTMRQVCRDDQCVVAHTFEDGSYSDARQVVWLVAEIKSKLAVEVTFAETWVERLQTLADKFGFARRQIWLISNEGFSDEANEYLALHGVFGSNRRQLQLLDHRLGHGTRNQTDLTESVDEFLIVVPMGDENELIGAYTVEQIARRLAFRPEAINQIKTAVVEACINAVEHSFSPDRKIYQRFRVGNDRLVITISSRGVVPASITGGTGAEGTSGDNAVEERRGWGLKLIRTLMDEVEFERVDEGTSLRMVKYLRDSSEIPA